MTKLSFTAGVVLPLALRFNRSIAADATQTQTSPCWAAEVLASIHCNAFREDCGAFAGDGLADVFCAPGNRGFGCLAAGGSASAGTSSSTSIATSRKRFPQGNGIATGVLVGACADNGGLS